RSLGLAETRQVNSRIGLGVVIPSAERFYAPGVIYMTCGPEGYLGLVRLEDGSLDLAAAVDPLLIRSGQGANRIMESLLRRANWPVPPELPLARIRGTPPLTRTTRHVSGHRFFVVGDATGYVEPFTGEGMAWGLTSAISLAEMASDAVKTWSPRMAQSWHHHHVYHVRPRQRWCRFLAGMLRHQGLTSALVKTLGHFPGLSNPVVRHLNITPFRLMERFG
ncbi:MAG: NAD(P)/FAD-dependent oxidoreductase, partial [Gemmataceae bacterium]